MPLLALLACSNMAIDGTVLDVTGTGVEGAMVTAVGTNCYASSNAEGAFSLTCPPGTYTLTVGRSGYISEEWVDYDAAERKRYDLGRIVLIKIPDEKGLLRFKEDAYQSMARGWIEQDKGGSGMKAYRNYCRPDAEVPVTTVKAGTQPFFDNESVGWHAWKLDEEGCAYRMSPSSKTRWEKTYGVMAQVEKRKVEEGKAIVLLTLEPGDYFIADWDQGFFTKNSNKDQGGFSGWYVRAE